MARVHYARHELGGRPIPGDVLSDSVTAFLLDLDGTLYTEAGPIPGAVSALQGLRRRGVPFRLVTNTTMRSRHHVVERLQGYGFDVDADDVLTAVFAGALYLTACGVGVVAPFVTHDALEDLGDFTLHGGTASGAEQATPDAVVIGDLGDGWTPQLLNEAFRYVMDGAQLVALQHGRYWLGPDGLTLDAGAWVAALEHATGRDAVVCGKPNREFFEAAVASLGARSDRPTVAMVGDDLWNDVEGAQRAGLQGWLVRTGKFREDALQASGIQPDRVIDSIAHLRI